MSEEIKTYNVFYGQEISKGPFRCPACGSPDITGKQESDDVLKSPVIWSNACNSCEHEWKLKYALADEQDRPKIEKMETQRFERIEVKELVLTDRKGRTRILLGLDKDEEPEIKLTDEKNREVCSIEQLGDYGGQIDISGINIVDENGISRITLWSDWGSCAWDDGTPIKGNAQLYFHDENEEVIYELIENQQGVIVQTALGRDFFKKNS